MLGPALGVDPPLLYRAWQPRRRLSAAADSAAASSAVAWAGMPGA
jgi:hypothetical protein